MTSQRTRDFYMQESFAKEESRRHWNFSKSCKTRSFETPTGKYSSARNLEKIHHRCPLLGRYCVIVWLSYSAVQRKTWLKEINERGHCFRGKTFKIVKEFPNLRKSRVMLYFVTGLPDGESRRGLEWQSLQASRQRLPPKIQNGRRFSGYLWLRIKRK